MSDGFGEGLTNENVDGNGDLTIVNHRFSGQYYDQETGRYLQSDPIGLNGGLNVIAILLPFFMPNISHFLRIKLSLSIISSDDAPTRISNSPGSVTLVYSIFRREKSS